MTHNHNAIFRAEKTTPNRDDLKVMIVGSMIGILMLLTIPIINRVYDTNFAERPFIRASVEIVQTDDYVYPMIRYDADATQHVSATWTAMVFDKKGQRLETRRGLGDYSPRIDDPKLWTWEAFFDTGTGVIAPRIPTQPFMVCVNYISQTRDSGVIDEAPQDFCSELFNPRLNIGDSEK